MLLDMKSQISSHGITCILDHPSNKISRTNCMLIANAFIRPELWTPARINRRYPSDFGSLDVIEWFKRQCNQNADFNLIISSESFCYMRTSDEREHFLQCLDELYLEVIPIIIFRNDKDWRRSRKAQLLKNEAIRNFMETRKTEFSLLDDWYFDKEAIMEFWLSISPDCIFIDYDKEVLANRTVIPAFLQAVNLPNSLDSNNYYLNRTRRSFLIRYLPWY